MNWSAPLNRGLVAWWKVLSQRMGGLQWRDLVGSNHGTLTAMGPSSPTSGWSSVHPPGGTGSLRCDGTDDSIEIASTPALDIRGLTITFGGWFFPTTSGTYQCLCGRDGRGYCVFLDASGPGAFYIEFTGAFAGVVSVSPGWVLTAWNHLIVLHNAAGVEVYLNGLLVGSAATTTPLTGVNTWQLRFGSEVTNFFFNGYLDDWRVYPRALSAREVNALYTASRTGYKQELRWTSLPLGGGGAATSLLPFLLQHGA